MPDYTEIRVLSVPSALLTGPSSEKDAVGVQNSKIMLGSDSAEQCVTQGCQYGMAISPWPTISRSTG